jgi:hypothetical protein
MFKVQGSGSHATPLLIAPVTGEIRGDMNAEAREKL